MLSALKKVNSFAYRSKCYQSYLIILDCPLPRDCKDWYDLGVRKSCVYPIYPEDDDTPLKVYGSLSYVCFISFRFIVIWRLKVADGPLFRGDSMDLLISTEVRMSMQMDLVMSLVNFGLD